VRGFHGVEGVVRRGLVRLQQRVKLGHVNRHSEAGLSYHATEWGEVYSAPEAHGSAVGFL
jgi:hypothetical protein